MKELKNKILNYLLFFSVLTFVSCSVDEPVSVNAPMLEKQIKSNEEDCTINQELMLKYLRLSRKDTALTSLEKVVRDGKTVAYLAKYHKGWELLAADKRQPIVLASTDDDANEIDENGLPSSNLINNMLTEVKASLEYITSINPIWTLLENSKQNKRNVSKRIQMNSVMGDGGECGMWVPVDTLIECEGYTYNPLITTNWHQLFPYYSYTPIVNYNNSLTHCAVGCVPVAVGQVIAKYRKNSSNGYEIPDSADVYLNPDTTIFRGFSTANWNSINHYDNAAVFLAFLGHQMFTRYGVTASPTAYSQMKSILERYGLRYDECSYNFQTVLSNLRQGHPVLVYGRNQDEENHAYIIHRYRTYTERLIVRMVWDPDYPVSDWERQTMDPELFYEPASDFEKNYVFLLMDDVDFQINWGWETASINNLWFCVRAYAASPSDGLAYSVTYVPNWSPKANETYRVVKILHNISNN